jgi:putative AbiEii toxin of type IV toxin-antitoxin system/AAA domain-containing protein
MPIRDLHVTNIGPFDDMTFEFDEHINVFVGPNSSGKSTTLMTLANIVTYPFTLPGRLCKTAPAAFTVHIVGRNGQPQELAGVLPLDQEALAYASRWTTVLTALGYSAFVPALRQNTSFRSRGSIAESPWTGMSQLPEELVLRKSLLPTDATLVRAEAVLERMVEFADRAVRRNDPGMRRLLTHIVSIASEILDGFPVEFWRIAEDRDGVFPQFRTLDGDIAFDIFSQGTQSVLQWLAYVLISYAKYYGYPSNLAEQPGIMIIDEIDAHLHPTAQQRIIPILRRHFPTMQIFCSTHSPLMLVGLQPGQLQLLQRDSHGTVTVSRNATAIAGQSTDAVLHQFFAIPMAASESTEETPAPAGHRRSARPRTTSQATPARTRAPRAGDRRRL